MRKEDPESFKTLEPPKKFKVLELSEVSSVVREAFYATQCSPMVKSGGRGESCGKPNCYARAPLTNCSLSTAKVMAGQGAE